MSIKPLSLLAALALTTTAQAQLESIVGPQLAAVGTPIQVVVTNDSGSFGFITGFYSVFDSAGNMVYLNPPWPSPIPDGQSYRQVWRQTDGFGNPVGAGVYRIDVDVPDPATGGIIIESHTVTINGSAPSVAPLDVPRIGKTRPYTLHAPGYGGATYVLFASGSSTTGIPTCGGLFPLDGDALFLASLQYTSIFQNFLGTLSAAGTSSSPMLALPPDPSLSGLPYELAFVVFDPTQSCNIVDISSAEALYIR
jgi:hypothetical protein